MGWPGPRKSCLLFRISLAQLVCVWGTKRQNCQEIKTSNADNLKTQGNLVIKKGGGISFSYPVEFWDGEFACKGAITWRYKGFIMVMLNHTIILRVLQLYYLALQGLQHSDGKPYTVHQILSHRKWWESCKSERIHSKSNLLIQYLLWNLIS